jgi:hypothetical protein
MAQAIRRAGEIDPAECRAAARERFSAARMIGEYFSLYGRLAKAGAARTAGTAGHYGF